MEFPQCDSLAPLQEELLDAGRPRGVMSTLTRSVGGPSSLNVEQKDALLQEASVGALSVSEALSVRSSWEISSAI